MIIKHSLGAYGIHVYSKDALLNELPDSSFIITDQTVRRMLSAQISESIPLLALEPGEQSKTLEAFGRCHEWLVSRGANRKSTLVALGGGVIGDLVGFVAATYMRGVPFIQIPSTLLAQVDSSVGGKVGIDLGQVKNLVGAFHAPTEVRLSVELLQYLPERQFINGMAEVWKYGAIMDAALFEILEKCPISPGSPELGDVIHRCIGLKAQVVEADEFETNGLRAILNFGHTVGHAIESLTGYGPVLHGEAIAIGMAVESKIGEMLGLTEKGTYERLCSALNNQKLPITHPICRDVDAMVENMKRDKKAAKRELTFSLLTEIGQCKLLGGVDEKAVRAALMDL
jgi:3-dehydroquinate synthase